MSDTKWTPGQLEAIRESGRNLLVAAAAGAGKTAVLVERIIRKITDAEKPVDIDRLLVVTFTNAAATEMRERIAQALAEELEKHPESSLLQRQMALLGKASIMTIHSFCLEVVKNNFHFLDLDPAFRIADEAEAELLKAEVIDELFEELYERESGAEAFLRLVECYGGTRSDDALQQLVLSVYEFVRSLPWPEAWLRKSSEAFKIQEDCRLEERAWGRILINIVEIELEGLLRKLSRAVEIARRAEGLEPYLSVLYDDISGLERLIEKCGHSWDELYSAFSGFYFPTLKKCGKNADKTAQEQVKDIRNEVKERIAKIRDDLVCCDSASVRQDFNYLYPLMNALVDVVLEFGERYAARKKEKSLLDFSDLEHFCLEILTETDYENGKSFGEGFPPVKPSRVAVQLKGKYDEILVDEYQDSNLVQEVILTSISKRDTGSPNMFMVGDVKQSIYRFRQARPELFLEKYNRYPSESGHPERKILLYTNFRSRKPVIDAVNCIFAQIMSRAAGEIEYDESEALNPGAEFEPVDEEKCMAGGPVELHIIDLAQDNGIKASMTENGQKIRDAGSDAHADIFEEEERPDNIQLEARLVVKRIRQLMRPDEKGRVFSVFDRAARKYRPIEYRDIVVLLRTTRNWAEIFMEELTAAGIPAYADTGSGYFSSVEVMTMISLLQVIDNPMQDIPLLAVLRSPIASFTADELADIRLADREGTIYEAMQKLLVKEEKISRGIRGDGSQKLNYGDDNGDGFTGGNTLNEKDIPPEKITDKNGNCENVADKVRKFLEKLNTWRDKAAYMPVDELIWYLYNDTGYYGYVGAMPGGVQRQANLRILFERARIYQETSYKGLFNFINFLEKMRSGSGDLGSAKILGENENVVRIMSIHKSKGLEFPVVIISGCGKQFNMQDLNRSILLHYDLGFGPELVDCDRRISYPSVAKQAIRQRLRFETLSEEMRILYVAMTRAREKLVITGATRNLARSAANWGETAGTDRMKIPAYAVLNAGCFLDWIGPAVMRHSDAGILRRLCPVSTVEELEKNILEDLSQWEIHIYDYNGLPLTAVDALTEENEKDAFTGGLPIADDSRQIESCKDEIAEKDYSAEIERRLGWVYPWEKASRIPAKVTVTEIKRRFEMRDEEDVQPAALYRQPLVKKPAFMTEETEPSAAEKGTILHFVMQHLDLDRIRRTMNEDPGLLDETIRTQVAEMVGRELLTEQQAKYVDIRKPAGFFRSTLGRRMLASPDVMREIPFSLELKCTEIYRDLPQEIYGDELVIMQGVVDCCFEEGDGLVIVDYKTDYVPPGSQDLIRKRYELQLQYYTEAVSRITGRNVTGCYIYLFSNGSVIDFG